MFNAVAGRGLSFQYPRDCESWKVPKPGPPVKLPAGILPAVFVLTMVTLLWLVVLYNNLFPWLHTPYTRFWHFWVWLHM
jgi:hypothetical protein